MADWNDDEGYYSAYSADFDANEFIDDYFETKGAVPTDEEIRAAAAEYEEEARDSETRFRAIASVYEKADRILTLDPVTVRLVSDATAPTAWSDGQNISLNTKVLVNHEDRDLVSLHGVNYHEVCHILYTPRVGSDLGKWVIERNYMSAYNILEDQRIETLFAARFPSTRVFLEASNMRYVTGFDAKEEMTHILIHGRRFIDYAFRKQAYQVCADRYGLNVAKSFADVIDEYRLLAFPRDFARAKELIERFQLLLLKHIFEPPTGCGSSMSDIKKGRPESAGAQASDVEKAKEQGDPVKPEDLKSGGDGQGDDGESSGDEGNFGAEKTSEETSKVKRLSQMANDILDDLADRPEAVRETKEFRKAVRSNEFSANRIKQMSYSEREVHDEMRLSARQFGEVLRQIQEEADPSWLYEQPSGKLNITRAMHADVNDLNRLFDRWYEGDDATIIEAAILLDRSGSMSWQMDDANKAAWTIKRGLESIDARVTVYTFNHSSRLLYSADAPAAPQTYRAVGGSGGTNPIRALEETEIIMEMSKRPTKIVFMVTDGSWSNSTTCNAVIKRMNDAGVITVNVFLGSLDWYEELAKQPDGDWARRQLAEITHGATISRSIAEPKDLVPLAQSVVTSTIKQKISR